MDIAQIRKDTPLHEQYSYINTAAASAPPRQVVEAIADYLHKTASLGPYLPSFRRETYAKVDEIREKAGAFIGASAREIAFVKNGTEAINFIAGGLAWNEGDEVILADLEFHSNFVPWLKLQREGKIKLKVLKTDNSGVISVAELEKLITPRTRLITVSHLPNASGALQPVQEICALAKRHNVLTLVNASQTLGLVPIDVKELNCDFLAACGRKWLRGPEGSGILYIREELIDSIQPVLIGWGGTSWDFETNEYSFLPIAKRVEAGCPIVPSILGLGAAIDYAANIGIQAIFERVKELTRYAVERMQTIPGIAIYGPDRIENRLGIIPFNVDGLSPDRITQFLEENRIIIEAGTFMANTMLQQYGIAKMARLSPHYFNTTEEIDRTVELIKVLVEKERQR
ncbi:aminotransferase class V-fold PLP-dependent enzyme [Brevibacillus marinus]|uniref:aminotransferase class V-fold PLP-dependent enzyme n=1 Tax=Brevibacillus marinus TaxID=2496837 RepID=UPI000F84C0B5|nr:aminotransferase class V-fold PLP-dependent enzyme [Brevibacillus marinus]